MNRVAKRCDALEPFGLPCLFDCQIKVERKARKSMCDYRVSADHEVRQPARLGSPVDDREEAHPNRNLQRPMMNERMRRGNEALEKRMRLVRLALKFGMELRGDEEWVRRDFDNLDQFAIRRRAAKNETGLLKLLTILVVELVTMAVALVNDEGAINLGGL